MLTRCLSIEDLERALSKGEPPEPVRIHLDGCRKCAARAREIDQNNAFLRRTSAGVASGIRDAVRKTDGKASAGAPEIEGFEFVRELHRGGQGVVYLARQTATKRMVAMKMLLSATLATSRQRRRFEREIEIAAGLRHPGIVTVFESGSTNDGWMWFAMEFVEGVPFDAFVNQRRPARREIVRIVADVCNAVAYAHQRGIIHRDLKPANIVIDSEGRPHVLDFGLAKVTGSAAPDAAVAATQDGEFMGTFAYAAPEQFHGAPRQVDTRTDVYALGTLLYEAVTGRHPFPASGSLAEFVRAVDTRDIDPPSSTARDLSPELEAVILCALAREPVRRYESAGMLERDLRRYLSGEPVEARRDSRWYLLRKAVHRHRFATAGVGILVLFAVTFAVMATVQARRVAHERDKALAAEGIAARTASTLADALRESNIERGRLLIHSGSHALAERIIWPEWFASGLADDLTGTRPPDDAAYWSLWELYSLSPCRRTLRSAASPMLRVALNRDAALIAGGSAGGTVHLWRTPDLEIVADLAGQGATITAVAFSPIADMLVTGDDAGFLTMWDVAARQHIGRFRASDCPIRNVVLAGDGATMLVHDNLRRFEVWSVDGRRLSAPPISLEGVRAFDADSTSRRIAVGGANDTATVISLDGSSASVELPPAIGPRQDVTGLRFSRDGRRLAMGREDGSVDVWDLASARRIWSARKHLASIGTLDFSPDGRLLASGGQDRQICVWDADMGSVRRALEGHATAVTLVRFIEGNAGLLSADFDGAVKVWDVADRPGVTTVTCPGRTIFNVAICADGRRLAASSAGGREPAVLCDLATGARVATLVGHRGVISGLAFSPDGSVLATGGYDHDVRMWDVGDGSCVGVLKGHENFVESVAFCLGGERLASCSDDNTVRIWDVGSRTCLMILRGHTGRCPMVAASPDGETVASCSIDGTIRVWSARDGSPRGVYTVSPPQSIRAICFTPDGRYILSGGDGTRISIWDLSEQRSAGVMDGSDHDVFCIKVSPDGRFAVTTTRGGAVQLWSLARKRNLVTLARDESAVFAACFTPDGRAIAFGGESGCVQTLRLDAFEPHILGNAGMWRVGNADGHGTDGASGPGRSGD